MDDQEIALIEAHRKAKVAEDAFRRRFEQNRNRVRHDPEFKRLVSIVRFTGQIVNSRATEYQIIAMLTAIELIKEHTEKVKL